ncbi:MAG TPA: RDD family protein [Thermoleophilaceae bacterium]|nr:RDD family protein [Thermoleophilaceae bacterium]
MPASGALAGWGPRFAATLIDAVMWFIVTFVIGVVVTLAFGFGTVLTGSEGVAAAGAIVNFLIGFALYAAYTGFMMARSGPGNGQTVGKLLLGVRAVRTDGSPVTVGTVAVRHWLMKYIVFGYLPLFVWYALTLSNAGGVGALVMALLYLMALVNYLWPLWDKENRAFHDMVASTRVVRA